MKMDTQDPEVVRRPDAAEIRQRRARVAYSYDPQNEDELALKVGEELVIMGEDEEGWYQAVLHGKTGVCPSNFVELIQAEEDLMEKEKSSEKRPVTPSEASKELKERLSNSLGGGKELDNKKHSLIEPPSPDKNNQDEGKGEIAPKKLSGVGFGNIFSQAQLSQVKLRPASHVETNGKDKPQIGGGQAEKKASNESKKAATNDSQVTEYAKAEFDYDAQNDDELSFSAGDIIRVITKDYVDEGWWKGEFKGKVGVFPDNFCTVIPAQPESKRPVRTPSIGKNETGEKADKADKEASHKLAAAQKSEKTNAAEVNTHHDKVRKTAMAKDDHDDKATDPLRKKESEKEKEKLKSDAPPKKAADEKDKVEKTTSSKKEPSETRLETKSTRLPTTTTVEKDKDKIEKVTKPEKPLKPVVPGKKPTTTSSRENTPPASDVKDSKEERNRAGSSSSILNDPSHSTPKEPEEPKVNLRHPTASANNIPSSSSLLDHGLKGSFDSVTSLEKLVHPTASRAKGPLNRRPPSMIRPHDANNDDGNFGWGNGIDISTDFDMTLKDREPKAAEGKKLTLDVGKAATVSRNDSFKKQLESTLSAQKSPTGTVNRRVSDLSPPIAIEEEVKALKEELKTVKEEFTSQIKELRDALKVQSEKTASLEKELEKLWKEAK